jgi:hypothetical protein
MDEKMLSRLARDYNIPTSTIPTIVDLQISMNTKA